MLVGFEQVETQLKNLVEGLRYDDLSEEERAHYEETFADDEGEMPDALLPTDFMSWIMNDQTIDSVWNQLMSDGIKIEHGDKIGKTIIFAQNHAHAEAIQKRFNVLFPHLCGHFARVIDNYEKYTDDLIDDFKKPDSNPQIAISVDMLDTGIDIPEIVNLVFFKKVRSKAKFWQMIGRGTRLCEDLFAPGEDKQGFIIFDYCGNFAFFGENPQGHIFRETQSISHRLFMVRAYTVRALQEAQYIGIAEYEAHRKELITQLIAEIKRLDRGSFIVQNHLKYYDIYTQEDSWIALQEKQITELTEHIASIVLPSNADDAAKLFDYLMHTIELKLLTAGSIRRGVNRVRETAQTLSGLSTIPQVAAQHQLISEILTAGFWEQVDIFGCEKVRIILRELVKYIEKEKRGILNTHFKDTVISITTSQGDLGDDDFMRPYNERVNEYVLANLDNIVIQKIKLNRTLTNEDIQALEMILYDEIGTREEYEQSYRGMSLGKLIRSIVGLDQQVANDVFSDFLNDTSLNQQQTSFIKTIISHVVTNGYMELSEFQNEPFKSQGSIIELFTMTEIEKIKSILSSINDYPAV